MAYQSSTARSSTTESSRAANNSGIRTINGSKLTNEKLKFSHGKNATFEVHIKNMTTGQEYNFDKNIFEDSKNALTKTFTRKTLDDGKTIIDKTFSNQNNLFKASSTTTEVFVMFPKETATTEYNVWLIPTGSTALRGSISEVNPYIIINRIDTVVSLSLTSGSNSARWTNASPTSFSATGREGLKPAKQTSEDTGFVEFSLVTDFSAGGGLSSVAITSNKQATNSDLSAATAITNTSDLTPIEDIIYISNDVYLTNVTTTLATAKLTIAGNLKVNQFGSKSETLTIDIDNFITYS
tara:strand:- start:185 stop:1072 length:888 start_codon:yes stop_codon:yes gene_type:complete